MSRETFVVLCAAAAAMCGCQSSKVKISGRIVGTEPRNIYLEEVTPLRQTIVDSTVLAADGSYLFRLRDIAASPSLYNVVYDNERIPLLVEGGDRVTVNSAGSVVRNYTVEGSAESELLREFYQAFVVGAQHLDEIASRFAEPNLSEERHRELMKEYTDEYFRIRREQLRFIVENKSLAAYLRQLGKMGEDPEDYASIWAYTHGETEPRFGLYVYPDFGFATTRRVSNLELE